VGQLLSGRPVHIGEGWPGDDLAVEVDLQGDVEAPEFGVVVRAAKLRRRIELAGRVDSQ